MFVVFRKSIKIFQAVVVVLSLSGVSLAASREDVLEGVKEECRSVISAFITAQQDAQEWHRSEIERFRTLSNDQEIQEFVRRYNDDADLLGQPVEVIRHKAEELFGLKDKEVSARIKRYEALEKSISEWSTEGVLSKQLTTLLLQCLVDLNERHAHPEVVARTLPADLEVYADKQRQLAEEDINRGRDLAFLLQLMGKPLGKKIDGIFSRFTQHPIFGGHFSVLQAYVQDLVKEPPLPDHYVYGLHLKSLRDTYESEIEKVQHEEAVLKQQLESLQEQLESLQDPSELELLRGPSMSTSSLRGKKASLTSPAGRLQARLKLDQKIRERAQKTKDELIGGIHKGLESWTKVKELHQRGWEGDLKTLSQDPVMRELSLLEEKAIGLLKQYRAGEIETGQWRVEEAAAKRGRAHALAREKEKQRQSDEDDEVAAAFDMDKVAQEEKSTLSEDEEDAPAHDLEQPRLGEEAPKEEVVDPRAEHARYRARKAAQKAAEAAALQPAEGLRLGVTPFLCARDYGLWKHFWGIPQSEKMRWGKFKSLFKALGFKKTSESGGSLRKFSRDGRSFDIHKPHGQRGDMLGLFDIKRIRRNLESKFGWSVETYKEKIN